MRAEPKPKWALSVERSRRALKHSDGLWNPSPNVGSRRPDATHSPRHPRLLDTRRVPLPTPQTTTCLTFRTDAWCHICIFGGTRGSRSGTQQEPSSTWTARYNVVVTSTFPLPLRTTSPCWLVAFPSKLTTWPPRLRLYSAATTYHSIRIDSSACTALRKRKANSRPSIAVVWLK